MRWNDCRFVSHLNACRHFYLVRLLLPLFYECTEGKKDAQIVMVNKTTADDRRQPINQS